VPVPLLRVDERLIHGQVTIGWGSHLRPTRYLVVDDALAQSPWEQDLHRLGTPPGVEVVFLPVDAARDVLPGWLASEDVTIVLTRDLPTMARLADKGPLAGYEVNLGGIHAAAGRERLLPYVSLGDPERVALAALAVEGVRVTAQDLPGTPPVLIGDGVTP
jgi:mannose/fructose/N-acetylgalactosamine-specific phosphotransferase system component IIB